MLPLASATAPEWIDRVAGALDELLVDHAHCEKKAAGTAIQLIFRYPEHGFLLEPLSRLAREELVHFEQVLARLAARGAGFGIQKPAPYAGRLRRVARSAEPGRLVDTLLCCALIEARSCERFRLLAHAAPDAALRAFYAGLESSEARHHGVYVQLAAQLAPRRDVDARLRALARQEAEILSEAPPWVRMHA